MITMEGTVRHIRGEAVQGLDFPMPDGYAPQAGQEAGQQGAKEGGGLDGDVPEIDDLQAESVRHGPYQGGHAGHALGGVEEDGESPDPAEGREQPEEELDPGIR